MVLGFGKGKKDRKQQPSRRAEPVGGDDDLEYDDEEEERVSILFQGALNGRDVNLAANAKLAQVGLIPAKELVSDALLRHAEAFRLEPKGDRGVVTFMIDGVPYAGGRMSWRRGNAIVQMLKLLAGLDIRERGKKQAGGIRSELENVPYELKVQVTPATGGERLTLRARDLNSDLDSPEALGMTTELRQKIRDLGGLQRGALLVCGPPDSGTSSTLYGVLRSVDAYLYTIYTIADNQGRELPHIAQFEKVPGDDLQETLNRSIRAEANIIHLDPIRDAETAKLVFASQKRVCMVAEFAAADAAAGIIQLVQWLGDAKSVSEGLVGIVSQKLVRLLCKDCKRAFRPNPKLVAKVGLPPETNVLYRHTVASQSSGPEAEEPCETCGGLGYRGRVGMFELIEMTDAMKKLVAGGASAQEIKSLSRKEKMISKQSEGLRLVAEGRTSLEELQRVFKS